MLKELGLKPTENEQDIEEDPYLILGYGVNAYMEIVLAFCKMFAMLTLASLPLYIIYAQGGFYDEGSGMTSHYITQFFLGNMGSSSMFCDQFRMGRGHAELSCPAGTHLQASHAVFGILSNEFETMTACH